MTSIEATNLHDLLAKRLTCLQKLHYASERQRQLVTVGNLDAILGHLAQKQHLVDALLETEQALAPHRGIAPEARVWASPEAREKCQAIISESDTLLAAILALDKESEADMTRQHKELEDQIKRLGRGMVAAVAYSQQSSVPASRETQTILDISH